MNFKDFVNESVFTRRGIFMLNEGIPHLEDLPPEEFISAVRNMSRMIATEKLDGANLIFGFDSRGRFYTSREAKGGGDRFYSVDDYTSRPADNGFKGAHAALQKIAPKLRTIINNGEAVEVEVLFGRQPNAIVYGSNYIAFLRMIPGDNNEMPEQNKIKLLRDELIDEAVSVTIPVTTTFDGLELVSKDMKLVWRFTSTSFIDSKEFEKVDVSKEIDKFEKWLREHPFSSFKTKKDFVEATKQFMLPIKEKLLDQIVRKIKPALRDTDVTDSEDIGIEGIVLLDPQTGKQTKLVDKSIFTLINQFNYSIRNQIKGTYRSPENYKDLYKVFNASIGSEGTTLYDKMLAEIANVIGVPGLSRYTQITRTIKKFNSPQHFINSWKEQDVGRVKSQIADAVKTGLEDVKAARQRFIDEWKDYKLTLKDGRQIQYTEEIYNRTLLVFAETIQELQQMLNGVQNAQTLADIANVLYGTMLKKVFS